VNCARALAGFVIAIGCLLPSRGALAQEDVDANQSPHWSYEIRGGAFYPELELFETFYGDDHETYYSLTGSYRFKDWLEVGGEYGQMSARGMGILTSSRELGGTVKYKLKPVHVFTNFIFQRQQAQRVVPYVGLGLTVAAYEQKVEQQPSADGRSDVDFSARVGVRFLVGSRGPTSLLSGRTYWRSYVFLEAQHIEAEVDSIQLGGETYMLGFRMEFDRSR